jgi:hypothetical protein
MLGALCGLAQAQAPGGAPGTPGTPPAAAQQAAPAVNAVTAAMQRAGVRRCAPQVQKVTDFLTSKSRSGTIVFPAARNPDDSLLTISSEIVTGNVLSYAGVTFAPRSDGCSAVYERVSHWQNTCDEVHAAQYANFKPEGNLQQLIKVYAVNPSSKVMMVPAGTGCLVILKEVLH